MSYTPTVIFPKSQLTKEKNFESLLTYLQNKGDCHKFFGKRKYSNEQVENYIIPLIKHIEYEIYVDKCSSTFLDDEYYFFPTELSIQYNVLEQLLNYAEVAFFTNYPTSKS